MCELSFITAVMRPLSQERRTPPLLYSNWILLSGACEPPMTTLAFHLDIPITLTSGFGLPA